MRGVGSMLVSCADRAEGLANVSTVDGSHPSKLGVLIPLDVAHHSETICGRSGRDSTRKPQALHRGRSVQNKTEFFFDGGYCMHATGPGSCDDDEGFERTGEEADAIAAPTKSAEVGIARRLSRSRYIAQLFILEKDSETLLRRRRQYHGGRASSAATLARPSADTEIDFLPLTTSCNLCSNPYICTLIVR